jgi:hypothetical protein
VGTIDRAVACVAVVEGQASSIILALAESTISRNAFSSEALVASSAGIAIVAIGEIGQIEAEARRQVAEVVGAGVIIVAVNFARAG